jgi:hypothetical protein
MAIQWMFDRYSGNTDTFRHDTVQMGADRPGIAPFDYSAEAALSPIRGETELSPATRSRRRRQPIGYGRFARAADAIRFAIEELPSELLVRTCLQVGDGTFDGSRIRELYDSTEFPLARRASSR